MATTSPRVFISYSWTTEEHEAWVVALATRLRDDGVDAILDKWDLKEGQDKHVFMEQMVTDPTVSKVLCVCDKRYTEKANGRDGGVGTESQIISKDVYDKVHQEKFVPLIRERDEEGNEYVPVFFRNRMYIDFCKYEEFEQQYDKLIRNIYGRPELKKPDLGTAPAHLFADNVLHTKTSGKFSRLKDAVNRQKPFALALCAEYLELFCDSFEDFRIAVNHTNRSTFDDVVFDSITNFLPYRDEFIEFVIFVSQYMNTPETYDLIHSFLEQILPFQSRPESVNAWNEENFDNYRFIAFELFLYLTTVLIRQKRYEAAAEFIESGYHIPQALGGSDFYSTGIAAFCEHNRSLDEYRKQRLHMNQISITAFLIKERATLPKVPFHYLTETDFLLFLRPYFPDRGKCDHWYTRLIWYCERQGAFELFARATSPRGFEPLKHLLKVNSLEELMDKIDEFFKHPEAAQRLGMTHSRPYIAAYIPTFLNLKELNRITGRNVGAFRRGDM